MRNRDETYDPGQKIVPNALPHIHGSSTGKRYCDHCGQRMIENELTKPQETYKGSISMPVLRSRSNLETPGLISEGFVGTSILLVSALGFAQSAVIPRTRDIEIGQLPKGSIRAHINIRDVSAYVDPAGGALTLLAAFLYYVDPSSVQHLIMPLRIAGVSTPQSFGVWQLSLVTEYAISDGAPPDLGRFSVEVISLTLGAATSFDVDIRANMGILFEVGY